MFIEYNPNPVARRVGDCAVRAITKALGTDWDTAYCLLVTAGFSLKDMPSSNSVWGSVLKDNGFRREAVRSDCEECYTAEDFCKDHPVGTYVLGFDSHTAVVVDGNLWDSWDSSGEYPQYYWVKETDDV